MSNTKVSIKGERKIFTFAHLINGAYFALENSKKFEEGRFYNCLFTIIFSAFCFEAYLNHIGSEKFSAWEIIEKKLQPKEKLNVISQNLNLFFDYSRRPFQTIDKLFKFRNSIAHGKSEDCSIDEIQNKTREIKEPKTKWEHECSIENAERYFLDVKEAIEEIHKKAGFENDPLVLISMGSYTRELIL